MTEGKAYYAQEDGIWFITLIGDVRFTLGPAIKALLDKALANPGGSRFVLDLSQADGVDSTCLGMLARIVDHPPGPNHTRPVIITGGADIHEILLSMCFDRIFELVESTEDKLKNTLQPLPMITVGEDDMLRLLLEAHQRLCAIDAKTHAKFRDVVEAFEAEVFKINDQ